MDIFTQLSQQPEVEIWRRYKNGDGLAFSYMYQQYTKILYIYGMKITPDKEIVKDCIQDLFVELWLYRSTVAQTDSIKYYLFKSLRRKIVSRISNENQLTSVDEQIHPQKLGVTTSYELDLIAEQTIQERRDKINLSMNCLTKRQKEAIFLKFYNELSYDEIASIMSLSRQAVYNLIFKALKELKKHLLLETFILLLLILF